MSYSSMSMNLCSISKVLVFYKGDFMLKVCVKCKLEKEIDEFHNDKNYADGHKTICKECVSKYNKVPANKERQRARLKLWRIEHRERTLELGRNNNKKRYYERKRAKEQELARMNGCIR